MGLPNITGSVSTHGASTGNTVGYFNTVSGCFYGSCDTYYPVSTQGSSYVGISTAFLDASKSNPIYGNSNTVQPPALSAQYLIKY